MGINFEINYAENPTGMYFTGQVVMGRAIITLDESIPIKGIRLIVRGYAEVRWEESHQRSHSDGSTTTHTDIYHDEEKYFDGTTECIETKGLESVLESGTHTYTFECPLPIQCPSSFEGTYGRIRYETKVIIVRPRKFNKSYSMGFNVLKIVDLNHLPELRIPAKMEIFKNFCCGPCKSRPLILSMDIPQTGYVPGEFIDVSARMVNHSSIDVDQVHIALNLIAFYTVKSSISTKTEKIAIAKSKFGAFQNSTLELKGKIQIPPTPPTCEDLCRIIKITYEVEVTAKVKGVHISPTVSIPITVGNIPYVARSANISEDTLIANLINGVGPPHNHNLNIELPPPSYQEAMILQPMHAVIPQKEDENTKTMFEKYTPRYPFYSHQFPTAATKENLD